MSKRKSVNASGPAIQAHARKRHSLRSLVQFTVILAGIFSLYWLITIQTDGGIGARTVRARTVTTVDPGTTPKLQSIFFGGDGQAQAVINQQTVSVGERVAGYTVRAISQQTVSLLAPDGRMVVLRSTSNDL